MRASIFTAQTITAICGLAGCVGRAPYREPTQLTALAPCEAAHVDTAGWRVGNVAELGLQFHYPRTYQHQNLGVRHTPGVSEDAWYRDGSTENVLSVRMVEPVRANTEISEWREYPDYRECTIAVDTKGTPPARVVLHAGGGVVNNYNKEYPPYTVVAEWRFPGGRVVRFVGSGPDSASQREHLAVVQTASFTHEPPVPVR